jgi:hypothetical protein
MNRWQKVRAEVIWVGSKDVEKKNGKEKAKNGRGTDTDFEIFE